MEGDAVINFAKTMLNGSDSLTDVERKEKLAEYRGFHKMDRDVDGTLRVWDARKEAVQTPVPERFHSFGESWKEVVARFTGRKFFILGAGSSLLKNQDLGMLTGELVYGINWTWEWFNPTFLQSVDGAPLDKGIVDVKEEVRKERERTTCLVVGKNYADKVEKNWSGSSLMLDLSWDDAELQEEPGGKIMAVANSLGPALQVASWFKPERVVLLGFDFEGAHFFGDGRSKGCMGHYGEPGTGRKQTVWPKLRFLRDELFRKGIPIAQVGKTALDVFPGAENMDHAINGNREDFLWP